MSGARIRVIVDQGYGVVVDPAQVRQAGWTPGQALELVPTGELADLSRRAGRVRVLMPPAPVPKLSSKEALVLTIMRDRGRLSRGCTQEFYGLELITCSDGRLKRGTIYVTLNRMEGRGLIVSHPEGDTGTLAAPPRRLYSATALGADALERHPPSTRRGRLLAAVAELGEATGVQASEHTIATGAATWWDRWTHPHVHPDMRQLERDGLLVSRESEPLPQRGWRPRIFYRLTEKGRAAVAAARGEGTP